MSNLDHENIFTQNIKTRKFYNNLQISGMHPLEDVVDKAMVGMAVQCLPACLKFRGFLSFRESSFQLSRTNIVAFLVDSHPLKV